MASRIGMNTCSVAGCDHIDDAPKRLCQEHYRRLRNYGTTERQRRPKGNAICSVDGCDHVDNGGHGMCRIHYARQYRNGTTDLINRAGNKRGHPLYIVWFEKKSAGRLCPEWQDFWAFVAAVGERPSPKTMLVRLDEGFPFGPDNFKWLAHLVRGPGETIKDWHARKWASRQMVHPKFERQRHLKRRFGLTEDDYAQMLAAQGDACAICRKPETSLNHRSGGVKRLSVDHCHTSGKVRELLCFRCNSVVGRIDEDVDLLDAMRAYIVKHNTEPPCPAMSEKPSATAPARPLR